MAGQDGQHTRCCSGHVVAHLGHGERVDRMLGEAPRFGRVQAAGMEGEGHDVGRVQHRAARPDAAQRGVTLADQVREAHRVEDPGGRVLRTIEVRRAVHVQETQAVCGAQQARYGDDRDGGRDGPAGYP